MPRESILPKWKDFCSYNKISSEYPITKASFYFDESDLYIYLPSFREWDEKKEPIYINPYFLVEACYQNIAGSDLYGLFTCSCGVPACNGFFNQKSFLFEDKIFIYTRDDGIICFYKDEYMKNGLAALEKLYTHQQNVIHKDRMWYNSYPKAKDTKKLIKQMKENIEGYCPKKLSKAKKLFVEAFNNFDIENLKIALNKGVDINFNPDKYDPSLLARALFNNIHTNISNERIKDFLIFAISNGLNLNTSSKVGCDQLDNSIMLCELIKNDEIIEFLLQNGLNIGDNTMNYWNLQNRISDADREDDFPLDYEFYRRRLELLEKYGVCSWRKD